MTSTERLWMTRAAHTRLQNELAALRSRPSIEVPDDFMDYDDTGEIETFLLGLRGAEDADIDVYSMQSPLGSAIAGARPGEQRTYSIPSGANLPVTLLKAVPYGMHTPKSARAQALPPRRDSAPRRATSKRTDSERTTKATTAARRAAAAT